MQEVSQSALKHVPEGTGSKFQWQAGKDASADSLPEGAYAPEST